MAKKKSNEEITQPEENTAPEETATPVEVEVIGSTYKDKNTSTETEENASSNEMKALIADLAEAQTKRDEYLDGWQRSIAEFSNYKKRIERDREMNQQNLTSGIIKRYIEIVDDLERALQSRPQEGEGAAWAEGIELIYRKILSILDSQNVKPMEALEKPFDPNFHEAIGHVEDANIPSGHVAEVIQNGYFLGERVLRPALVRIAN